MPQSRKLAAALIGALLLAAPAAAQEAADPKVEVKTRVIFASAETSSTAEKKDFLWAGLDAAYFDQARHDQMAGECFVSGGDHKFIGAVLGFLAGPVIHLLTDHLKSQIDDEIKKYGQEFKVAEQASFYHLKGGVVAQDWRCFRVTRLRTVTPTDGKPVTRTVDFDFIGQVSLMDAPGAPVEDARLAAGVKVRPLRVYLSHPLAKGDKIGLAGNATFDAVWRDGGEGKHATLFTTALFEEKFRVRKDADKTLKWVRLSKDGKVESSALHYFYLTKDDGTIDANLFPPWREAPLQPLIPFSNSPSVTPGSAGLGPEATYVTVAFSGAEVGSGQGLGALKALSKLLGATQSDLDSVLTKAAKKVIQPDEPDPPAKPEYYCGTFTSAPDGSGAIKFTKQGDACPTAPSP